MWHAPGGVETPQRGNCADSSERELQEKRRVLLVRVLIPRDARRRSGEARRSTRRGGAYAAVFSLNTPSAVVERSGAQNFASGPSAGFPSFSALGLVSAGGVW